MEFIANRYYKTYLELNYNSAFNFRQSSKQIHRSIFQNVV